jgi:hypothetical protein
VLRSCGDDLVNSPEEWSIIRQPSGDVGQVGSSLRLVWRHKLRHRAAASCDQDSRAAERNPAE